VILDVELRLYELPVGTLFTKITIDEEHVTVCCTVAEYFTIQLIMFGY
jgi:hypothetical protein